MIAKFAVVGLGVAAIAAAVALLQPFGSSSQAASTARLASAFGVVERPGGDLIVHVTVFAPPGVSSATAVDAALAAQHARPARPGDLQSAEFATTGLVWDEFSDADPGNDFMLQSYNPANEPVNGEAVLLNTHATWNAVPTSSFTFSYGGTTTRCPSLVDECSGPQTFDGFNDVAYMSLVGPCNAVFGCTLGVTWFSTSIDEADMALNTKASWVHDCVSPGNSIDSETVTLHENGHALGLAHSNVAGAVMEAFYGGAQCGLHQDDIDGASFLYPGDGDADPTDTPTPTSTPTDGPSPTPTDTQEPTATPTPDDGGPPPCPPGHQRRGLC